MVSKGPGPQIKICSVSAQIIIVHVLQFFRYLYGCHMHGLLAWHVAYWHGAWSNSGLLGLLVWCVVYWWADWPTCMVHGVLLN